jgi:hypothetical protein
VRFGTKLRSCSFCLCNLFAYSCSSSEICTYMSMSILTCSPYSVWGIKNFSNFSTHTQQFSTMSTITLSE